MLHEQIFSTPSKRGKRRQLSKSPAHIIPCHCMICIVPASLPHITCLTASHHLPHCLTSPASLPPSPPDPLFPKDMLVCWQVCFHSAHCDIPGACDQSCKQSCPVHATNHASSCCCSPGCHHPACHCTLGSPVQIPVWWNLTHTAAQVIMQPSSCLQKSCAMQVY